MALTQTTLNIRGTFCIETIPKPASFIIFGASGDLTHRKLIPSLFFLYQKALLSEHFYILGCARTQMDDEKFRASFFDKLKESLGKSSDTKASDNTVKSFLNRCFYIAGDYNSENLYINIKNRLVELDKKFQKEKNHIFYLATPPSLYIPIVQHLGKSGLSDTPPNAGAFRRPHGERGRTCIIVEKPFGRDLESARKLDSELKKVFKEEQIYRIDHYLGKETVQNILLFRFANSIFEPIWNRRYIDNIQITVAELLGVEHRAGYFEQAGLLRDMFQNHMLQMLSLVAMEPPISFDANRVRDEKVKLLRAITPIQPHEIRDRVIRAQYGKGTIEGREVPAYRDEKGVAPDSTVETYVAMKLNIDNWRWQGVPFYLRAGKRLAKKSSKIVITFKNVPHSMFQPLRPEDLEPNILIFHVQPEEGISLRILAKRPGPKLCMDTLEMVFRYSDVIEGELPDAYERLLLDCMLGDQTLFIRNDDMEVSWSLITPIAEVFEDKSKASLAGTLHIYPAGSWGPVATEELLQKDGRSWVRI